MPSSFPMGSNLGYCPQFDALIDQLTGVETLQMFAGLHGIPFETRTELVSAIVKAVGIEQHARNQVSTYSGGNKRRLSLGVALIGRPKVLLLDEPTTGVDPAARRAIWTLLARVRRHGTALVLTSHSMEECEALCSKIAIMVAGRLRCFGSPQHLKSKFSNGYSLHLKVGDETTIDDAKKAIVKRFPGCILKEQHYTRLAYEVSDSSNGTSPSWSHLFGTIEQLVEPLGIVDYSLSQTTLERMFLDFSRLNFDY